MGKDIKSLHSSTRLHGSVKRMKGEREEIRKQLEKNGFLTDYKAATAADKVSEENVKINWGNLFN